MKQVQDNIEVPCRHCVRGLQTATHNTPPKGAPIEGSTPPPRGSKTLLQEGFGLCFYY